MTAKKEMRGIRNERMNPSSIVTKIAASMADTAAEFFHRLMKTTAMQKLDSAFNEQWKGQ